MAQAIAATTEGRSKLMVVAALLFAAIAAVLVYVALQGGGGGGAEQAPVVSTDTAVVVVAARDVAANTILTAAMLDVREVPLGSQLTNVFASTAGVVGLPTRFPLEAGEQITPQKVGLNRVDDEDDVALVLPPGLRAFAVEVSEVTGAGGLLLPGHFVDVIAVFTERGVSTSSSSATMILQDIELVAVGQQSQEPIPAIENGGATLSGRRPDDAERQPEARTATLAVTPGDAQLLALVQESGATIWLSLRPVGDHDIVPSAQTGLEALPGQSIE